MIGISNLEARAQSYAKRGDPTFEDDVHQYLEEIEGKGWTLHTSRELDGECDDVARTAAWWLLGRGLTICALDVPLVAPDGTDEPPVGRAVSGRTELLPSSWSWTEPEDAERSEAVREGRISVVAVDDTEKEIVLLQALRHGTDGVDAVQLDDLPSETLLPLLYLVNSWDPPERYEVVTVLFVTPESDERSAEFDEEFRFFGVEPEEPIDGNWKDIETEPRRFATVQWEMAPPGTDGPTVGDVRLSGPPEETLRQLPPCRGVLVGATVLELLSAQQRATGLGVVDLPDLIGHVTDTLEVDGSIIEAKLRDAIDGNPLISKFKLGGTVYPFASPGGILRAAALRRRLGDSFSTDETLDLMDGHNVNISHTVRTIQVRSRKGELTPYSEDRP